MRLTLKDFKGAERLHQSDLKGILSNPNRWAHHKTQPQEQSDAMRVGEACHVAIFEPDKFAERYAIAPQGLDRRKKDDKELWAKMLAEKGEANILMYPEAKRIKGIALAVKDHGAAAELLEFGQAEVSKQWNESQSGFPMEGRLDWILKDKVIDLKTTEDASAKGFQKSIIHFGYDIQAYCYLDATGLKDFIWICVESEAPHDVAVYRASQDIVDYGAKRTLQAIRLYESCQDLGEWMSYGDEIDTIGLPDWMLKGER